MSTPSTHTAPSFHHNLNHHQIQAHAQNYHNQSEQTFYEMRNTFSPMTSQSQNTDSTSI